MITDNSYFIKYQINTAIQNAMEKLTNNIPCKVESVNDNYTVNVTSLIDNFIYKDIPVLLPIGTSVKTDRFKFGLLIVSTYRLDEILTDSKIQTDIKTLNPTFGFFIPMIDKEDIDFLNDNELKDIDLALFNTDASNKILLETDNIIIDNKEKASITMEDGSINISNNNDNNNIKLSTELTINSDNPISISTQIATLKEVIDGLVECINLASTGTGNQGAPIVPNPNLATKVVELQTKINGLLK